MFSASAWEFNCPQFVDFEAGLETSTTDFWLEDENEQRKAMATLSQPHRFRMATPKVKIGKNLKNSPFVKVPNAILKTDDEKMALMKLPRRYSKSESCLNRPVESWMTPKLKQPNRAPKPIRKRSLSQNNIKQKVYPVTPMCLKRTLKKTKEKGKTTEEIEMDKIAELQNKLKQQLRLNEVNLKRMKSNKAPYPAQRVLIPKNKSKARATVEVKDDNPALRVNGLNIRKGKSQWDNFEKVENSKEIRRTKSRKLQSVLDSVFKKSEVAPNVLRVVNGNNKGQYRKKYSEYCGINFYPNQEKTIPKPFSFDTSSVSSQNASFCLKDIKADSFALKTPNSLVNKENIFRLSHRKGKK